MKIGLIARSEDRGLGNLTWEWAQHMRPDRVLVVVPNHKTPQRLDRYPDATVMKWDHHRDGHLDREAVCAWLAGLDVVYSAETFYDWRVCTWARELGVRTVCHVMPEFFRHGQMSPIQIPAPDVWWTPTRWRLDTLPPATRVVPVPIATERFRANARNPDEPFRWLHVAGTRASGDRNGTRPFRASMIFLRGKHTVRIRSQYPVGIPEVGPRVRIRADRAEAREYWELYDGFDAVVLPRRYGGLSLPALEAMAAGCAVLMSDVDPQSSEWPVVPMEAEMGGIVNTPAGAITCANVAPRTIAETMDRLAADPDELFLAQLRAGDFAEDHSWIRLESAIRAELEDACR